MSRVALIPHNLVTFLGIMVTIGAFTYSVYSAGRAGTSAIRVLPAITVQVGTSHAKKIQKPGIKKGTERKRNEAKRRQ